VAGNRSGEQRARLLSEPVLGVEAGEKVLGPEGVGTEPEQLLGVCAGLGALMDEVEARHLAEDLAEAEVRLLACTATHARARQ
jgi:hypothetical protein